MYETRLSYSIEALVQTGEFRTFTGVNAHIDPERLLSSLPGIGPRLARHIHDALGVSTLEELECAAHNGRLCELGIGPKRLRGIVDSLTVRLASLRRLQPPANEPSVADLLTVDQEYRNQAEENQLPTIAPRRFNLEKEAWLPL